MMSWVEVPGPNSSLTPIAFSPATSSGGMMPPPKTTTSSAPFSLVSSVMVLGRPAGEHAAKLLTDLHDLAAITGHRLPVEALAVVRPARDEVQMEVRHRLEGGRAVSLEHVEPVGLDGAAQGVGNTLGGNDGRLQVFVVGLEQCRRVVLGADEAVARVQRIDVHEAERPRVLVDLQGRNLSVADLAEHTIAHARLPAPSRATRLMTSSMR